MRIWSREYRCKSIYFSFWVCTIFRSVSYTHLRAHETVLDLVCRLLLEKNAKKKRLLNKGVSEQVVNALRKIVSTEEGTAKFADVEYFEIGGKTGTADQPKDGAYSEAKINTFASIFPTSNPQYVFIVMLDTPQKAKDYYYKYRHRKGGWKGTLYNTAGWTSVEVAGKIIDKIGPILATKYIEIK